MKHVVRKHSCDYQQYDIARDDELRDTLAEALLNFPELFDKPFVDKAYKEYQENSPDVLHLERDGKISRQRPIHRRTDTTFLGLYLLYPLMKKYGWKDTSDIKDMTGKGNGIEPDSPQTIKKTTDST